MTTLKPVCILMPPTPVRYSHIAFLGLVRDDVMGCYHAAYREFTPKHSDTRTDVRYQRYDADMNPVGESRLLLEHAEDPRVFSWRGNFYCATIVWRPERGDWQQIVINLLTGSHRELHHNLKFAGKNWVPVTGGKTLKFIRSLEPLVVLECDDNFHCRLMGTEHPGIGWHRGGGAAIECNGVISGIGHLTRPQPLSHTPFRYVIDLSQMKTHFAVMRPEGFGDDKILDPTCELGNDVLLTTSQVSWWHDQKFSYQLAKYLDQEQTMDNGRTYSHGGDMGDLIYACCLFRRLSDQMHDGQPLDIVLCPTEGVRSPQTPQSVELIKPLLLAQPYIASVRYEPKVVGTDLNRWRTWYAGNGANLCYAQLVDRGFHHSSAFKPWLTVPIGQQHMPVVIHRSPRYHNDKFPWKRVVHKYRDYLLMVGLPEEHEEFVKEFGGHVPYHPTRDFMELSQIIAGAKLFIGNQSSPYAIAEALKMDTIQETMLVDSNCVFPRANARYVVGDTVELPEL